MWVSARAWGSARGVAVWVGVGAGDGVDVGVSDGVAMGVDVAVGVGVWVAAGGCSVSVQPAKRLARSRPAIRSEQASNRIDVRRTSRDTRMTAC